MIEEKRLNIEALQNKIVNQANLAFLVMGIFAELFTIIRATQFGFTVYTFVGFVGILGLALVQIYRNRLSVNFKMLIILGLILMVLVSGMLSKGFLASAKLFIPIIPIFISFIFSFKRALFSLTIFLMVYIIFAFLITQKIHIISLDFEAYLTASSVWLVEILVILFTAFGLLYVGKNFRTSLLESYNEVEKHQNHLEVLVDARTEDLNLANKKLIQNYEELFEKNRIIEEQNRTLSETIDHLKETQSQLLHAEKMASLGVLTAGIAHEINNPLNYIMGAYEGLKRNVERNTIEKNRDQVEQFLYALKVGVERSTAIVKGLNQFSRKSDDFNESCNLHQTIDNSLTMMQNQLKYKIDVVKEYHHQEIILKGNAGRLHQLFVNLISNAVHAIEDKGVINIKTYVKDQNVIIDFIDTGSGIPTEILSKVTDPFFTTKEPGKGTGLGLSIVYNIVKEHDGSLDIYSKVNEGTTIKVKLTLS